MINRGMLSYIAGVKADSHLRLSLTGRDTFRHTKNKMYLRATKYHSVGTGSTQQLKMSLWIHGFVKIVNMLTIMLTLMAVKRLARGENSFLT
jgi:hypothetical protein